MSLAQNKQVALESFRVIETGDPVAADRIIAPDFVNREADDDVNRPDRGLRGPAALIATSRWLSGTFSDLRFDHHEVVAEDELHGPTEIASRGRLKSPPEADRNRHLRAIEIAI